MNKSFRLILSSVVVGAFLAGGSICLAKSKKPKPKNKPKAKVVKAQAGLCPSNIATSTVYFIPNVKDYCPTSKPCAAFKKEVNLQGAGTLPGNKILTYAGKTHSLGSCTTAFGASGNCLTPFISVAADPRFYSMGDIISMPALKGKVITMPNGKKITHPGYLIVDDVGSAIKGANRFDFFTGSFSMYDSKNAFGVNGDSDTQMASKKVCSQNKAFTVLRRKSAGYNSSLAAIENAMESGTMYASTQSMESKGAQ